MRVPLPINVLGERIGWVDENIQSLGGFDAAIGKRNFGSLLPRPVPSFAEGLCWG
jgi:hypothetical protein